MLSAEIDVGVLPQHSALVPQHSRTAARKLFVPPPGKVAIFVGGRIKYIDRPGYVPEKPAKTPKAKKPPRAAPKAIDRKYLAAARELRDRYLEHINSGQLELESSAKYDIACRQLAGSPKKSRLLMNPRAA